jgi:hypothetical protein
MLASGRLVCALVLVPAALGLSCAHTPPPGPPALTTFDYVDDEGTTRTLARHLGKVVLLDLCMASVDPCLLNAKAVSEACDATCSDEVVMITLLMDGMGPEPVASYRTVLKVHQQVHEAGEGVINGRSAIGAVGMVPRLILFDKEGHIVEDVGGLLIANKAISERIADLLD